MNARDFKERTITFAVRTVRFVETLPRSRAGDLIARQLLSAATSVGANYRSACRAKSRADFIAKMGIVEEESDESLYWMELLIRTGLVKAAAVEGLINEATEILALAVASIRTARSRK